MATIAPPNAALFDADPLEQIYAKGTLDRNMAGLSALMMTGAGMKADARRQDYMGALGTQNDAAMRMQQLEEATKIRAARMKETSPLIQHGFDPRNLVGGSDLSSADDPMTQLVRAVQQSIVTKNNAEAAAAGQKGAGKESTTVQTQEAPFGPGMTTVTSKGGDPAAAYAKNQQVLQKLRADAMKNPQSYSPAERAAILSQAPHTYGSE